MSELVRKIQLASPLLSHEDIASHMIRRFSDFAKSVDAKVVADQIWKARRA